MSIVALIFALLFVGVNAFGGGQHDTCACIPIDTEEGPVECGMNVYTLEDPRVYWDCYQTWPALPYCGEHFCFTSAECDELPVDAPEWLHAVLEEDGLHAKSCEKNEFMDDESYPWGRYPFARVWTYTDAAECESDTNGRVLEYLWDTCYSFDWVTYWTLGPSLETCNPDGTLNKDEDVILKTCNDVPYEELAITPGSCVEVGEEYWWVEVSEDACAAVATTSTDGQL